MLFLRWVSEEWHTNGWVFFFFFQAEDGIRDRTVTGVQTCALPIVSRVVADDALEGGMLELAGTIAGYTSYGLRNTKEVMWHNLDTPNMAACIALENRNQELGGHTPEVQEFMGGYRKKTV